jgi:hypothetical protein
VKGDREVVLAAAKADVRALDHAAAELWKDRVFVLAAVQYNWMVWLSYVPHELRADREITLTVLSRHARALKHVSKDLLDDREIALAAFCQLPQFEYVKGALDTLLSEHAAFVFRLVAPELRSDREFMIAAAMKDWHTCEYATPELWADRDFVLSAVTRSGHLLKKASATLKADQGIVLAAVTQEGHALEHAHEALLDDRDIGLMAVKKNHTLFDVLGAKAQRDPEIILMRLYQRITSSILWTERQVGELLGNQPDQYGTNTVNWARYLSLICLFGNFLMFYMRDWKTLDSGMPDTQSPILLHALVEP